jgi:hypothetical protein
MTKLTECTVQLKFSDVSTQMSHTVKPCGLQHENEDNTKCIYRKKQNGSQEEIARIQELQIEESGRRQEKAARKPELQREEHICSAEKAPRKHRIPKQKQSGAEAKDAKRLILPATTCTSS